MSTKTKVPHGSKAWFDMVGTIMVEAATLAKLPPEFNVSLVERYTDGVEISPGLLQGLRFEINGGRPTFRAGAKPGEQGDITVEVLAADSHALNTLRSEDPRFLETYARLQSSAQFTIDGDLSRLGSWFTLVHDRIVDRTAG
jgi:hypothetical protein